MKECRRLSRASGESTCRMAWAKGRMMSLSALAGMELSTLRGRHFWTKLMSRYIGAGQNDWFAVRLQELVSKAKNPGGFLRKNVFRVHFCLFFL